MSFIYILSVLLIILLLILRIKRKSIIGKMGEGKCALLLSLLPKENYKVINDVLIKIDGYTSQIDHIVVSTYGIFVIETKNYKGFIYGKEYKDKWTQNIYGNKYTFHNPLLQNYSHIKAIQSFLNLSSLDNIKGIVAFSNNAHLRLHNIDNVVTFRRLLHLIKSYKTPLLTTEEVLSYENLLRRCENYTRKDGKEHVKEVKSKRRRKERLLKEGLCPLCGSPLIKKNGKYGSFLGCSNYPKCHYTKDIK